MYMGVPMNKLREIRKQRGLTQYELGKAIKKYQALIWQIEKGYCQAKVRVKLALAQVLGVGISDIFPNNS